MRAAAARTPVLVLGAPGSTDVDEVGPKAANLARSKTAALPVLPGFAMTPAAAAIIAALGTGPSPLPPDPVVRSVEAAWTELTAGGTEALVVRSSSAAEDRHTSSQAGRFTSVVDVRGWPAFVGAVGAVVDSAGDGASDMAVLVQRYLDPRCSGVCFGLDPVTGRRDRRVVTAVTGGPQRLVSGEVDGTRYVLTPRGRRLERQGDAVLDRRQCIALARLARRTARLFGAPQDMEWAFDHEGRLWLLQSRPVTTAGAAQVTGPVLGPGPVAETFPDPLWPLEESLWLDPLRRAITEAVRLTGSVPGRRLAASPILTTVGGRVAADLEVLGAVPDPPAGLWRRIDPRPALRRLAAAWRVGRLRVALPALGSDLARAVDADLTAVPALRSLPDGDLFALLRRAREALVAVHGHEMLAGMLHRGDGEATTAASAALASLAASRARGFTDDAIVAAEPIVLALTVPAIGRNVTLPAPPAGAAEPRAMAPPPAAAAGLDRPAASPPSIAAAGLGRPAASRNGNGAGAGPATGLGVREALRLRARWLHELSARGAGELGRRLAACGVLADAADVRLFDLDELERVAAGDAVPDAVFSRRPPVTPPLPAAFRLTASGSIVAVIRTHAAGPAGGGRGASPGRGIGRVDEQPAAAGAVLVVPTLDPRLAPLLAGLAGLVAETGSELSHLAILAREHGVPTVVGVDDAVRRFPPGSTVMVDGTTGEVALVETS